MCWDNKNRAFRFLKDPFANATHKQLIHRPTPVRTNNNHIHIELQSFTQNCLCRSALHKEGCCIQPCSAQSFRDRLNPAVLIVERSRKRVSDGLRTYLKSNEVWLRLCDM